MTIANRNSMSMNLMVQNNYNHRRFTRVIIIHFDLKRMHVEHAKDPIIPKAVLK